MRKLDQVVARAMVASAAVTVLNAVSCPLRFAEIEQANDGSDGGLEHPLAYPLEYRKLPD